MASRKLNEGKGGNDAKMHIDSLRKLELNQLKAMCQAERNIGKKKASLDSINENLQIISNM